MKRRLAAALGFAILLPALAAAQVRVGRFVDLAPVNGDVETYLRLLPLIGKAPVRSWTVRELLPSEIGALLPTDTAHPWGPRVRALRTGQAEWGIIAPEARLIENSAFSYGFNEGAVWAGRGLTAALSGGIFARVRGFSMTLDPVLFRAQNQPFELAPNGREGALAFGELSYPGSIDLPRRFGDAPYQRFDLGQSAVRAEAWVVAGGLSNANQHWGPALSHPLILGNNAPGFPHLYFGTRGPVDFWLFKLNVRSEVGRLDQSEYSPQSDSIGRRMMTGMVASITPRSLPGVELGATRFFHSLWPRGGLRASDLLQPLTGFFGNGGRDTSNQISSLFVRAAFPSGGVEVYGEYARDDASEDRRDLTLEPDHISGYTLGVQKTLAVSEAEFTVLRAELLNTRVTNLQFSRPQTPFYIHTAIIQGHTQRGIPLGSAGGFGGSAAVLAIDRYDRSGKWTASWDRLGRSQGTALPPDARGVDVVHSLSLRRMKFARYADWNAGVTISRDFNREFRGDVSNLRLDLGARVH